MASSATLTTTHLPTLRNILDEWNHKRPAPKGFLVPLAELTKSPPSKDASKDVIVAFRTRPPLPNEAADKFHADPDAEDTPLDDAGQLAPVEFCAGITVASAEPGVFFAHVPGMKVTAGSFDGPNLLFSLRAVVGPNPHAQALRGGPRLWARRRQRGSLSEDGDRSRCMCVLLLILSSGR
jgi:hypothetical protein